MGKEENIYFITNGNKSELSDLKGHESNGDRKSVTEEETVIDEDDVGDNDNNMDDNRFHQ